MLTLPRSCVFNSLLLAASPVWSPSGAAIAYIQGNGPSPVATARPDGSGVHVLIGPSYAWGIDWSPDGQWIVAANLTTDRLDLINATTGQTITLPFAVNYSYPTWRPVLASGAAERWRTKPVRRRRHT